MLFAMIKQCGGVENISRILNPDSRIILEIKDQGLLKEDVVIENYNPSLKQVTFLMPSSTEVNGDSGSIKQQLLEVGRLISQQQLKMASNYLVPVTCPHRPKWHISPPQGLLNDPNGFIYHQGEYHLFYQLYPYGCEHKDKHWVHLSSLDLVNWHWKSLVLMPSDYFDSHGVFSGHALSYEQELLLFYTGNVRIGEERDRQTMQCMASSSDSIRFIKHGPVITELPPNVTPHCRDPKVVFYNNKWLMLLGAQRADEVGRLAIYESLDLKNWTFVSLCGDELGDFGYMWECPDFFKLGNQEFIVICPQGIKSQYVSNTVKHHNRIFKASFDKHNKVVMSEPQTLDHGFDFYAPQTLESKDGRRIMCGWMGLPDEVNHESCDNGWVHQLTALRELSYHNNHLVQKPLSELSSLRSTKVNIELQQQEIELKSKSFELIATLEWGSCLSLYCSGSIRCEIRLNSDKRVLELDRSRTLIREGDTLRELALANLDQVKIHIFSDNSSLEIFIDNGRAVMSARIFTPKDATVIKTQGNVQIENCWLLAASSKPFLNL